MEEDTVVRKSNRSLINSLALANRRRVSSPIKHVAHTCDEESHQATDLPKEDYLATTKSPKEKIRKNLLLINLFNRSR